jgi:outer membrane protein TolC
MCWRLLIVLALLASGCTRAFYRRQADRESYQAINERDHDPRWQLPSVQIAPPPESRLFDPYNPDRPPLPPDDPAAAEYMRYANGMHGYRHWHKNGDASSIENPNWRDFLLLDKDGILALTPERSVELGLLNSPPYYNQLDNLYLAALALTLNRFEFALHWFGTNDTFFTHFGSSADETNTLSTSSMIGFTKAFAAGGQLMVDLANSFVFQFAGPDTTIATSNIAINLVQPVLRGFGRDVRMEGLTQGERNLLYAVRGFARFRKSFTFEIATNRYLSLLLQEQNILNQRANIASLEQNFHLHEALYKAGSVSSVKVDLVYLSLKQGQLGLVQSASSLESARDAFKSVLGLPADIPIKLDNSQLAPFELTDPDLTKLQGELDLFLTEYRELDQAPPLAKLQAGFKQLRAFHARTLKLIGAVEKELERWHSQIKDKTDNKDQINKDQIALERAAHTARARDIKDLRADMDRLAAGIEKSTAALTEDQRRASWESLQRRTNEEIAAAAQLFVIETQIRVYLIRLTTVQETERSAIDTALDNRLDLMNRRAQVVDAWRQIDVTASALKAGLDFMVNANIATPPLGSNPVDFRASASAYSVGFHFDGPLNREVERNVYRTSQINYEEARRAFISLEDQIIRTIRQDLRTLQTETLNFEISRQSLIAAARQVESAREDLLNANDPTSTQNILTALNSLLSAKNSLIQSWVNYETTRIQLLLDMDVLQLDERGLYIDEHRNQPDQPAAAQAPDRGSPAQSAP